LPDAGNFFEAATIYFGRKPALSIVCTSRAEAELISMIASEGLRGPVPVLAAEQDCVEIKGALEDRLAEARAQFEQLAAERAGTDDLREQLVHTLHKWFINGREESQGDLSATVAEVVH
jgi:hypothetical protein